MYKPRTTFEYAAESCPANMVSHSGLRPLHLAVIGGHPSIAGLLLQHGADVCYHVVWCLLLALRIHSEIDSSHSALCLHQ